MQVAERLRFIMKLMHLSGRKFARQTNIPYTTLRKIIEERNEPSAENLRKIASSCGLNIHWLLTGEGEMFLSKPTSFIGTKGRLFFSPSKSPSREDEESTGLMEMILEMLDGMPVEDLRDIQKHIEEKKQMKDLLKEVKELKEKIKTG